MSKYPQIFTLASVRKIEETTAIRVNRKYVPARPLGFPSIISRFKCAWMVFTGRADALIWPEDQ